MRKTSMASLILIALGLSVIPAVAGAAPRVWARVLDIEGELWIAEKPASVGSTGRIGDEVRTGPNSAATIKLRDDSVLLLRSNTRLTLSEKEEPGTLDLLIGAVLAVFSEGPHTINTPTTVTGVRGTGLYLMVESPTTTYACVCFGTVDFHAKADPSVKTTLMADHHKAIRMSEKDGQALIEEAGMEGHGDDEVERLKGLLDEPFKKWTWRK